MSITIGELLPELVKGHGDIIVAQDQRLSAGSIQDQVSFSHMPGLMQHLR